MPGVAGHPSRQARLGRIPQLGDHPPRRHALTEVQIDGPLPLLPTEHDGLQSGRSRVQHFVRTPPAKNVDKSTFLDLFPI